MRTDVATVVAPAGDAVEGGDFFLVDDDGTELRLVVGDASGHGPAAAAPARRVRALFERRIRSSEDPCQLLEGVNADLGVLDERFVTAIAAIVDRPTATVRWSYAGHVPPHRLSDGRQLNGVDPGVPLGVQERVGCSTAVEPIAAGDGLLLFTDGLEDVVGPGGDRFGSSRIARRLTELSGSAAQEVVDGLKASACAWGQGHLPDDVCMVAVRLT